MSVPALLLAVLGLGAGLLGPLVRSALGFAAGPALPLVWVLASMLCSVTGLLFGGWRASRIGAAPAFGRWAGLPGMELETVTHGAGVLTFSLSRRLGWPETRLDGGARGLGHAVIFLSGSSNTAEQALDTGGRSLGTATIHLAANTERVEQGFSASGNALARGVGTLGNWARGLETGKLYLYTLALFVAVLLGASGWLLRLL